jgi:hypothetical protein
LIRKIQGWRLGYYENLVKNMKQIKEIRVVDETEETVTITFVFDDDTEETGTVGVNEFKKWLEAQEEDDGKYHGSTTRR